MQRRGVCSGKFSGLSTSAAVVTVHPALMRATLKAEATAVPFYGHWWFSPMDDSFTMCVVNLAWEVKGFEYTGSSAGWFYKLGGGEHFQRLETLYEILEE